MISGIGGSSDMWNQMNIRSTKSREQMFNRMDQDGSGGIDKNELAAVLEKMSEKTGTTVDTDQLFSQYNSDDDKELSQDETKNLMESLRTEASQVGGMQTMSGVMGMGGMGMGGMQGGKPPGPPPDFSRMFQDADTDSDGSIGQSELQAIADKFSSSSTTSQSVNIEDLLAQNDSDSDGKLNESEAKTAFDSLFKALQPDAKTVKNLFYQSTRYKPVDVTA